MTDYLGHLAARSLGLLPAARPRLASRFEPVTPGMPPPLEPFRWPHVSAERSIPPPAARPATIPAASQDAHPRHVETRRERQTDDGETSTGRDAPAFVSPRQEPASVAARLPGPEPLVRSVVPESSRFPRSEPVEARHDHRPLADRSSVDAAAAHDVRGERDPWDRLPRAEVDGRRSRIERRRADSIASREDASSSRRAPDPPPPDGSRRYVPFEDASTSPVMAPDGAGTVHVSIGRVDVRAIAPEPLFPPRRPRPPAPGPSLSLDEYLKSRSGR
jgi:hypothetical protein